MRINCKAHRRASEDQASNGVIVETPPCLCLKAAASGEVMVYGLSTGQDLFTHCQTTGMSAQVSVPLGHGSAIMGSNAGLTELSFERER